jgi:hypothetical protein
MLSIPLPSGAAQRLGGCSAPEIPGTKCIWAHRLKTFKTSTICKNMCSMQTNAYIYMYTPTTPNITSMVLGAWSIWSIKITQTVRIHKDIEAAAKHLSRAWRGSGGVLLKGFTGSCSQGSTWPWKVVQPTITDLCKGAPVRCAKPSFVSIS